MEINWHEVTNSTTNKKKEKNEILSQIKELKIDKRRVNISELHRQTGISRITLKKWLKDLD